LYNLLSTGIGTWGLNKTVGWAWDITNFVWWVGIGHAGINFCGIIIIPSTMENGINRSAEAIFCYSSWFISIIHMGRPWLGIGYYLFQINLVLYG
jgi:molybdopterin-containing oxidoreductase family membrane subunit